MADPVEIIEQALRELGVDLKAGGYICAALEAAGYRIAGPEPTEEIQNAWHRGHQNCDAAYKAMHAKLPLYGSE